MPTLNKQLEEILGKYHPNPREAVWDCHGTWVAYHKDLEIIAAKAGITFDTPTVLDANVKEKAVAICVTGLMGERREWSIGEAAPGNNKNAYPFAMAEKRGKDRVILKLIGLSGFIYSEEEADNFKPTKTDLKDVSHNIVRELLSCTDLDQLGGYWGSVTDELKNMKMVYPEGYDACVEHKDKMKDNLTDVAERAAIEEMEMPVNEIGAG